MGDFDIETCRNFCIYFKILQEYNYFSSHVYTDSYERLL
jgi:hypothetical protein